MLSICLVRTRNGICSKAIPHKTKGGSIGGNNVPPKKKEFLGQIDRIAPWGEWVAEIKPWDYKGERAVSVLSLTAAFLNSAVSHPVRNVSFHRGVLRG